MKKSVLGIALALLVAATLLTGALAADDVTVISSPDELIAFRKSVNDGNDYEGRTVVLGDNIDLSLQDINWTPIGTGTRSGSGYTGNAFKGTFDGRGFTISGLTIDATVSGANVDDAYGLFGVIDGATVTNLTLANVHITVDRGECVGGVVGLMVNGSTVSNIEMDVGSGITAVRGLGGIVGRMTISGTIKNCVNEASINGSGANVGGIVGAAYYTAVGSEMYITNCKNYGAVTCTAGVAGGIAGLSAANVSGCENHAVITGNGTDVAGIVAEQQNAGSVTNCVNNADITNTNSGAYGTGGIVGWLRYNGSTSDYARKNVIEVSGNVNHGKISGGNDGGGIVGTVYNAAVVTGNENYAERISGKTFAGGIVGNLQFTETPLGDIPPKDVSISNNISTTSLENIDANCKGQYAYDNTSGTEPGVVVTENSAAWAAQIGAQKYATLAGAMDAAVEASGATIELLNDVTLTETVVLDSADADIKLDLCDCNITGNNCRVLWIKSGSMAVVSTVGIGKIETVAAEVDAIDETSSVIRVGSDDGKGNKAALTVGTYGEQFDVLIEAPATYGITVFGSNTYETLTVYGDVSASGTRAAIAGSGNDVNTPTTITIDGGGSASADNYYAIYHPQKGVLTVGNCNIEGRGGIQMCAGELVIKEKTGIYAQNIGAHGTIDGADGAIIDGAAVSLVKRSGYGAGNGPTSVSIEGGSFHSKDGTPIKVYSWNGAEQPWAEAPTGFISGGKFSNAVEPAWLAPGLVYQLCVTDPWDEDSEREYSYYSSLEAALENVKEDWVITQVGSTGSVYTVKIDRADGSEPVSYKLGAGIELTLPTLNKPGYIFMGWKCSDGHTHQANETVTVEKDMTFTAVWSNLPDIEPGEPDEPDEPDVPDFPFTDVSVNAWYYEAVKYVYENGIMNGMDRYSFQPNGTLTRAMVWTMLARLDGVDTEGGNSWYAKAQEWATANSVSDGENPTGEVTREQLVTMLWRYAGSPTYTADLSGYVDTADISSWAEQAMCWAVATGVIEGDENSALTPKASTTRAQAAAMFMRFIEL